MTNPLNLIRTRVVGALLCTALLSLCADCCCREESSCCGEKDREKECGRCVQLIEPKSQSDNLSSQQLVLDLLLPPGVFAEQGVLIEKNVSGRAFLEPINLLLARSGDARAPPVIEIPS